MSSSLPNIRYLCLLDPTILLADSRQAHFDSGHHSVLNYRNSHRIANLTKHNYQPMRHIKYTILTISALILGSAQAQPLTPIYPGDRVSHQRQLFIDAGGQIYSDYVLVNFSGLAVQPGPSGHTATSQNPSPIVAASRSDVISDINSVHNEYGSYDIHIVYPDDTYGPQTRSNIRTGSQVDLADISQQVHFLFDQPVPMYEAVSFIEGLSSVEWADPPMIAVLASDPNDASYVAPDPVTGFEQWNVRTVNGPQAWAFTRGNQLDPVVIGISDDWNPEVTIDTYGLNAIHPDLRNDPATNLPRLDNSNVGGEYGNHGARVAATAGSITNNAADVPFGVGDLASLGWNVSLKGDRQFAPGINRLICNEGDFNPNCTPVDIINMSWVLPPPGFTSGTCPGPRPDAEAIAIESALKMGVIAIASSGNGTDTENDFLPPGGCTVYPAAFYFEDSQLGDNQVIAVSATGFDDGFAMSVEGEPWNFSPGNSPVTFPEEAFIDVAAPGRKVRLIGTLCSNGDCANGPLIHASAIGNGTSFSGPLVASLASLLISVNPTLEPSDVYEAITESSRKEGSLDGSPLIYSPDVNGNAWSPYTGYGILDAEGAIIYVLENFGGSAGVAGETMSFPDGLTIAAGTTVEFLPGSTVEVGPGESIVINGILNADNVAFVAEDSALGWNGIEFLSGSTGSLTNGSVLDIAGSAGDAAIMSHTSSPVIEDMTIETMAGSPAYGIHASAPSAPQTSTEGPRVKRTTISTNGAPAVYVSGGVLYLFDSDVEQLDALAPALESTGGRLRFGQEPTMPPTNPDPGLNTVTGGEVRTSGRGVVNAGTSGGRGIDNQFCDDAASVLNVSQGGIIYAYTNTWDGGNDPTQVSGTGVIYFGDNQGAATCTSSSRTSSSNKLPASNSSRVGDSAFGESELEGPGFQALMTGLELRSEGDYQGAATAFEQAFLAGEPTAETALTELAYTYSLSPLPEIPLLLSTLSTSGDYRASATAALASVREIEGEHTEAVSLFDTAATLRAESSEAFYDHVGSASVFLHTGNLDTAETRLSAIQPHSEDQERVLAAMAAVIEMYTGEPASVRKGNSLGGESFSSLRTAESLVVYPNPATSQTRVELVLGTPSERLTVALYDALGRRVRLLHDASAIEGEHAFALDTGLLAPGVYAVVVRGPDSEPQTRRLTVLR